MTVQELIKELEKIPNQNKEVYLVYLDEYAESKKENVEVVADLDTHVSLF